MPRSLNFCSQGYIELSYFRQRIKTNILSSFNRVFCSTAQESSLFAIYFSRKLLLTASLIARYGTCHKLFIILEKGLVLCQDRPFAKTEEEFFLVLRYMWHWWEVSKGVRFPRSLLAGSLRVLDPQTRIFPEACFRGNTVDTYSWQYQHWFFGDAA